MSKLYVVRFDTQRNRVYSNWEFITEANNKRTAIETARDIWYNVREHKSHMFHCEAVRIDDVPEGRELNVFKCADWRVANWGRRS